MDSSHCFSQLSPQLVHLCNSWTYFLSHKLSHSYIHNLIALVFVKDIQYMYWFKGRIRWGSISKRTWEKCQVSDCSKLDSTLREKAPENQHSAPSSPINNCETGPSEGKCSELVPWILRMRVMKQIRTNVITLWKSAQAVMGIMDLDPFRVYHSLWIDLHKLTNSLS